MMCHDSQSGLRFFQRHWQPDGTNVARICWTDIESDMTVKLTIAVCEYHRALLLAHQEHIAHLWAYYQAD